MKAGKSAIWPRLSCQYSENTVMDLPSSVDVGNVYLFNTLIVGPGNPSYVSFAQVETTFIYSILPCSPTYLFKEEKLSY